jgi:hypothetical protein
MQKLKKGIGVKEIGVNTESLDLDNIDHLSLEQLFEIKLAAVEILHILKRREDKGGRLIFRGTVLATQFSIIDTQKYPEHMVKGYTVENTGTNPLFVAHNAALSSVGPDIIDAIGPNEALGNTSTASPSIFELLDPGDITEASYNEDVIKNIYLLAQTAPTTHKTKLVW